MPNENGPTLEEKVIEANPDQAFIDNVNSRNIWFLNKRVVTKKITKGLRDVPFVSNEA